MVVYDVEIVNPVDSGNVVKMEGIETYAKDWNDYLGMGISVIGIYDYKTDQYYGLCGDNEDDMKMAQELISQAEVLIGFNNLKFDNPLVRAFGINAKDEISYDILRQLWFGNGLTEVFNPKTHGGYNLDAVAKANTGHQKSGKGVFAPWLWAKGQRQEVIDYCINDVKLTKELMDLIFASGGLTDPKNKKFIRMALPKTM